MSVELIEQPGADPGEERRGEGADDFERAYGEPLEQTIDVGSWSQGVDLEALYRRLEVEVGTAVDQERRIRAEIRTALFPRLATRSGAPPGAGVYATTPGQLDSVHRRVLFGGQLEACDGTVVSHDTLVMTVTQIGVCLISYQGRELAVGQRLFRRDLRASLDDPVEEALALLERRRARVDSEERRDPLSDLARRGIMAYAERAVLLRHSGARWRMGHGNPTPYELLTGSGNMKLLTAGLDLLRELVEVHQRFVFVPSRINDRSLLTLGDALRPLEYAVVETTEDRMRQVVENGHYERGSYQPKALEFAAEVGPKVVLGVYRASPWSPARPFFAHADHVHEAALVALADSVLQEHRGFPLSIDLADATCRSVFGPDTFAEAVRTAYAAENEPTQFLDERETRER